MHAPPFFQNILVHLVDQEVGGQCQLGTTPPSFVVPRIFPTKLGRALSLFQPPCLPIFYPRVAVRDQISEHFSLLFLCFFPPLTSQLHQWPEPDLNESMPIFLQEIKISHGIPTYGFPPLSAVLPAFVGREAPSLPKPPPAQPFNGQGRSPYDPHIPTRR